MFSKAPEALNAIDMVRASGKLVLPMINSVMLRVANINKSVVAAPAVTMDNRLRSNATANNGLQCGFRAVRHNLRIDFAVALQESEDTSLATSSTTALATNAPSAEVALINFDFPKERRSSLTFLKCADES